MSANSDQIPDAWDDNWENKADTLDAQPTPPPEKKVSSKVTKAQRRAHQAEFNRQLWAEAEAPQTFHFAETRSDVPLRQDFKPTMTVLSRKPQLATRQSSSSSGAVDAATAGVGQIVLNNNSNSSNNNNEDDSDDEAGKRPEPTPEERHAIALRNLEEKQRKYEEARERLFGSPSATTSGASSPGSTTPPRQQQGGGEGRGKGKGRGGVGSGVGREYREKRDSSAASSNKSRNLYDPASPARENVGYQQNRDRQLPGAGGDYSNKQGLRQPSRNPRGPDASGRGGFRFGHRGGQAG